MLILLLPAETRKYRGSKNENKENVNGNFEPRKGLVWVLKESLTCPQVLLLWFAGF